MQLQDAPLVSVGLVKSHTKVVAAFHTFFANLSTKPETAKKCVLQRACQRFAIWLSLCDFTQNIDFMGSLKDDKLPPLDVLLVLYTYMLHPLSFFEDSVRLHPQLLRLKRFPLQEMALHVTPKTAIYKPTLKQMSHWTSLTGLPFTHVTSDLELAGLDDEAVSLKRDATGHGRLLADVKKILGSRSSIFGLGGTILARSSGQIDLEAASLTSLHVANSLRNLACDEGVPLEHLSAEKIEQELYAGQNSDSWACRVKRILAAYTSPLPYSIDLLVAVEREEESIDMIHGLHWISPSETTLGHIMRAMSRYTDFLALFASGTVKSLQPALDIDFIWHTHQLNCDAYRHDMLGYIGVIPDHDPSFQANDTCHTYDSILYNWKDGGGYPMSWGICPQCHCDPCVCRPPNCRAPPDDCSPSF